MKVRTLTPLQFHQHRISEALQAAAKELDEAVLPSLSHYAHQRVLVELGPPIREVEDEGRVA